MTDRRQRAGDTAPEPVPFAGLRRHAPALAGGFIILVAIWLVPDLTPPSSIPPPVTLVHAEVIRVAADRRRAGVPCESSSSKGPNAGDEMDAYLQGPSGQQEVPRYGVGDEVIVNVSQQGEDEDFVAVADCHDPAAGAAARRVCGRRDARRRVARRPVAARAGPDPRDHHPDRRAAAAGRLGPVPLAVVSATIVTIITFILTEGIRPTTVAAAAGTFLALALTSLLAVVFNALAQFTGAPGLSDLVFLQTAGRAELDLGGCCAAVIFGALGILDDVTVTAGADRPGSTTRIRGPTGRRCSGGR